MIRVLIGKLVPKAGFDEACARAVLKIGCGHIEIERYSALSQRLLAGKRNASVDDFLKERKADWKEP